MIVIVFDINHHLLESPRDLWSWRPPATQPSSLSFPSDPIVSPAFPNVPPLPLLILSPSNKENTKSHAYEVKREINWVRNRFPIPLESQIVSSRCWYGPMVKSYQAETRKRRKRFKENRCFVMNHHFWLWIRVYITLIRIERSRFLLPIVWVSRSYRFYDAQSC